MDTSTTVGITFADRLQALLKARGWTHNQLAEALGVSRQQVGTWVRGAVCPRYDDAQRILARLEKTEDR